MAGTGGNLLALPFSEHSDSCIGNQKAYFLGLVNEKIIFIYMLAREVG